MIIIPVLFLIFFLVPIYALANMHEIVVTPKQSCGMQCVIETTGFDTKQEAMDFWNHYQSFKGVGGHAPYQVKDSDLWFVDYQCVED
jgi:hypothetical protein